MKVIIIHGSYGNPEDNWFPWLKTELLKRKVLSFIPTFPTPDGQSLEGWLKAFEPYEKHLGNKTVLVGHSLGSPFILRLLERGATAKAAFLVSGFTGKLGNRDFDTINSTFVEGNFDWEKIKGNCPSFHVFCSDNDPYVPRAKCEELAANLGAEKITIKGGGHFNTAAGYSEFPLILKKIESTLGFHCV